MATVRHLKRAPVTEALVDIRVKARDDLNPEDLRPPKRFSRDFPQLGEQRGIEASFAFEKNKAASQSTKDLGLRGFFLKTTDETEIAQFRVDGFTYNKLKPYSSWDEILPEALRLWEAYKDCAQPAEVTRLALRYINHISVQRGVQRFNEIMTAPPPLPPGVPSYISQFFTRVTIHSPDTGLAVHVAQGFEPGGKDEPGTYILDIDAFHERPYSVEDPATHDKIVAIFQQLRELKNRVFFSSLTEETVESFE